MTENPTPKPYRPSAEEAAFLLEWGQALGATEAEAAALIVEPDQEPTP
jgi:hypothetical protein